MAFARDIAALAVLALGLTIGCRQSTSYATATKPPLVELFARGSFETTLETRRIVFGSGNRRHLVAGWSKDERNRAEGRTFVWATALDAVVSFDLLHVTDQQFLVTLSAFPTERPQHVTVLVNDQEVSSFTAAPIYLEYRFVAPATILRRGRNLLTFRHTELGQAPTHAEKSRRFAAAYSSILLGPECLPLRAQGPPAQPEIRAQKARQNRALSLAIVGPAALRRRLEIPAGTALQYRLSLPASARAAAVATLRVDDGTDAKEIVTRVAPGWFGGASAHEVEIDLAPWSGRTVDLELEVAPDVCRAPVTAAVIDRAAIVAVATPG